MLVLEIHQYIYGFMCFVNCMGGVMVSVLASSVSLGRVKQKTIKLVSAATPLSTLL